MVIYRGSLPAKPAPSGYVPRAAPDPRGALPAPASELAGGTITTPSYNTGAVTDPTGPVIDPQTTAAGEMPTGWSTLHVPVPAETLTALREHAKGTGQTVSTVVASAVRAHVEPAIRQLGIR